MDHTFLLDLALLVIGYLGGRGIEFTVRIMGVKNGRHDRPE